MSKLTKNQKAVLAKYDKTQVYGLPEACALLKEITYTKFDASVEITRIVMGDHTADDPGQGGLSGSGRTDYTKESAVRNGQADFLQGGLLLAFVGKGQILDLNHGNKAPSGEQVSFRTRKGSGQDPLAHPE